MRMDTILELTVQFFILWGTILVFALVLFRFGLKKYMSRTVLSSLLLTLISLQLQIHFQTTFPPLVPIVQVLALIGAFVIIYRIHWICSIIMAAVPYGLLGVVETIANYLLLDNSIANAMEHMKKTGGMMDWIIIILVMNTITIMLKKLNLGFTFISRRFATEVHQDMRRVALACIGLIIITGLGLHVKWLFVAGTTGTIVFTGWLVYTAYHKELQAE